MKYPSKEQQLENLKNLKDENIDFSDIPPITKDMLKNAVVTHRIKTTKEIK